MLLLSKFLSNAMAHEQQNVIQSDDAIQLGDTLVFVS